MFQGKLGSWVSILLVCLVSYHLTHTYFLTSVIVQGRSMMPTLQDGDRYLLDRLSYRYRGPRRGELVVLRDPGHEDFAVKRVVALPGESVQVKDGVLYINGRPLAEPYLASGTQTLAPASMEQLLRLGRDQYFVLGDNRAESEDSRYYGAVKRDWFIGSLVK